MLPDSQRGIPFSVTRGIPFSATRDWACRNCGIAGEDEIRAGAAFSPANASRGRLGFCFCVRRLHMPYPGTCATFNSPLMRPPQGMRVHCAISSDARMWARSVPRRVGRWGFHPRPCWCRASSMHLDITPKSVLCTTSGVASKPSGSHVLSWE